MQPVTCSFETGVMPLNGIGSDIGVSFVPRPPTIPSFPGGGGGAVASSSHELRYPVPWLRSGAGESIRHPLLARAIIPRRRVRKLWQTSARTLRERKSACTAGSAVVAPSWGLATIIVRGASIHTCLCAELLILIWLCLFVSVLPNLRSKLTGERPSQRERDVSSYVAAASSERCFCRFRFRICLGLSFFFADHRHGRPASISAGSVRPSPGPRRRRPHDVGRPGSSVATASRQRTSLLTSPQTEMPPPHPRALPSKPTVNPSSVVPLPCTSACGERNAGVDRERRAASGEFFFSFFCWHAWQHSTGTGRMGYGEAFCRAAAYPTIAARGRG